MIDDETQGPIRDWLTALAADLPAGGVSVSGSGEAQTASYGPVELRGDDLGTRLMALHGLVASGLVESGLAESPERVLVQVEVADDRSWSAVLLWEAGCEVNDRTGFTRTLDLDARPTEPLTRWRPPAGQPWPQPSLVTGDPVRLAAAVRAVLPGYTVVNPPATPEAIAAAQAAVGLWFPPELAVLYGVADAGELRFADDEDESPTGLYAHYDWLSLDRLVQEYASARRYGPAWFGWSLSGADAHLEPRPLGRVRRTSWHPGWIPFAHDGGGNFLAVDVAPGPLGGIGQVVEFGRDLEVADYVAPSLTDLVLRGPVPRAPGRTSSMLTPDQLAARVGSGRSTSESLQLLAAADPDLQELRLFRHARVEVAVLNRFPVLVELFVAADEVELAGLPAGLEVLTVRAPRIELGPLRHHPALRHVRLEGAVASADVLATFPALETLTLVDDPGPDLAAVLDRPGLRHLSAPESVWRALPSGPVLPGLAALTVSDTEDLDRGIALTERFDRPGRRLRDSVLVLRSS